MDKEKIIDSLFELYANKDLSNGEREVVKSAIKLLLDPTYHKPVTGGTINTGTITASRINTTPYDVRI